MASCPSHSIRQNPVDVGQSRQGSLQSVLRKSENGVHHAQKLQAVGPANANEA